MLPEVNQRRNTSAAVASILAGRSEGSSKPPLTGPRKLTSKLSGKLIAKLTGKLPAKFIGELLRARQVAFEVYLGVRLDVCSLVSRPASARASAPLSRPQPQPLPLPRLCLSLFLFQKPFKKPNAPPFASRSVLVLYLYLYLNLVLILVRLHPPGRSPVCHPHGRIAVPCRRNTIYCVSSLPHLPTRHSLPATRAHGLGFGVWDL